MEHHDHDHSGGHHDHERDHRDLARHDHGHGLAGGHGGSTTGRRLSVAIVLNAGLAVAQVAAGLAFGSVAVLADAGHQAVDAIGLVLGFLAIRLSRRPVTGRRTWGWGRADAMGAQLSAVVLLASLVWVVAESIRRIADPEPVVGLGVLLTGVAGVLVNGGSLLAVGHAGELLALRAARLHLIADLAGSVVLIVVGGVVRLTGWERLDPLASIALSASLTWSAVTLLRHSTHVLLDGAPLHLDQAEIAQALRDDLGVLDVHHVHVWTIAPGVTALSAHLEVEGSRSVHDAQESLERAEHLLRHRFGIGHTTLQVECHPCAAPAHHGPADAAAQT